jgi:hypothetical protein
MRLPSSPYHKRGAGTSPPRVAFSSSHGATNMAWIVSPSRARRKLRFVRRISTGKALVLRLDLFWATRRRIAHPSGGVSNCLRFTGGSKDFFNAKDSPIITFRSTKVVQGGPNSFDLEGDFTIRGVTKTEKLTLTDSGKGSTSGSIDGTMAFDRKDYGMNKSIPFIKIANRVEVISQ